MNENLTLDPNITLEDLISKAEGGHSLAQYTLAKHKQQMGEREECIKWMRKAADGEFFLAQFEMGLWHLLGHVVEYDPERAVKLIHKGVDAKFSDAMRMMAVLYALGLAVEKDWEKAVDYLLQAADLEDPLSLRQVGFLIRGEKGCKALSDKLITRAACYNEPVSLAFLGKEPDSVKAEEIPEGWEKWPDIRKHLLALEAKREFAAKDVSAEPHIQVFEGALSPEECLYLRVLARPALTPDVQILGGNPKDADYQKLQNNSVMVFFPIIQDVVVVRLTERLAGLAEASPETTELPVVQHYAAGQEFKPHVDYMDPENPQQAYAIQQAGQRTKSVFAYLNGDYEGGETDFPEAGIKVKGKEGDVLVLDNMDAIGLPNPASQHASLPVVRGEKWLLTLWIKDKNQVR